MQTGPPDAAVAALSQPAETPERMWTQGMMRATAEEVAHMAGQARGAQVGSWKRPWAPWKPCLE